MAKQADLFPITSTPVALPDEELARIAADIQQHLDAAEAMIARLDSAEPDPDLEDNGDAEPDNDAEPDLGWPEIFNQSKAIRACAGWEAANDLEQDNADLEPSLGSTVIHVQTDWGLGGRADREQDCDALGTAI